MSDYRQNQAGYPLQDFDNLYQQNASYVYKIALYILQDPLEAEDLCHDVFLEVIRRPEQYDPKRGSIRAWLGVKTRSRAIDRLRRQKVPAVGSIVEPESTGSADPTAEAVLSKLERENLHESLRNLNDSQRGALAAIYFRSMRQKDWAEATGRPLGTVKSLVRYGVNNIRKHFIHTGWLEP